MLAHLAEGNLLLIEQLDDERPRDIQHPGRLDSREFGVFRNNDDAPTGCHGFQNLQQHALRPCFLGNSLALHRKLVCLCQHGVAHRSTPTAYEVAREHDCPLLYIGDDFARTDLASAPRA